MNLILLKIILKRNLTNGIDGIIAISSKKKEMLIVQTSREKRAVRNLDIPFLCNTSNIADVESVYIVSEDETMMKMKLQRSVI